MKSLGFALGLAMLGGSPAVSQTDDNRTLSFHCNDLVVIGRLKNGEFHAVEDRDDILGHGWVDATLLVRRVVRGEKTPSEMPVRYFAHTYMRDDRDFMIVLSPQPDGALVVRMGQLISAHPKLAPRCS
jgi:hypothetical protein